MEIGCTLPFLCTFLTPSPFPPLPSGCGHRVWEALKLPLRIQLQDYKHGMAQINSAEQIQKNTRAVLIKLLKHELRNIFQALVVNPPGAKRRQLPPFYLMKARLYHGSFR